MAYEATGVPVSKSQEQIRHMIYAHKGTGVIIVSQRPREGFEAMVTIADLPYHVRVMATCRTIPERNKYGQRRPPGQLDQARAAEERRVWRVLYWHLKAMFEAADSGVIDLRDVIMPYIVTRDGRTLSEHVIPRMAEIMTVDTNRLLPTGSEQP